MNITFIGTGKLKSLCGSPYCNCCYLVTKSCQTLCDLMDYSTPGSPVFHSIPEFVQTHVHWVSDTIQLSHPLSSPSPPGFCLSQHQGLFQCVSSSHQVAKVCNMVWISILWRVSTMLLCKMVCIGRVLKQEAVTCFSCGVKTEESHFFKCNHGNL